MQPFPVTDRNGNTQDDWLAQEVPVALIYNEISHVVMMATPRELDLFALGFSLSEGIIAHPRDIYGIDIVTHPHGIEVQIELSSRRFMALKMRRRAMNGRTGCGICGTEQLAEIRRPIAPLPFTQQMTFAALDNVLQALPAHQPLRQQTGCTHAAIWLTPQGEILGSCEDVGRHVALDKLLGLRARQGWTAGGVLISSRASYEMVQKVATCGVELLFAVSAPTTLAREVAEDCRLTLVGFSRPGKGQIYSHAARMLAG